MIMKSIITAAGMAMAIGGFAVSAAAETPTIQTSIPQTNDGRMDVMMRRIDQFHQRLDMRDAAYANRIQYDRTLQASTSDSRKRYAGR